MAFSFSDISRALTKRRHVEPLERLEGYTRSLSPSDRFIAGVLVVIMGVSATVMLASTSRALAVEIPARGGSYTEGIVGSPRFINPILALSDADRDITALVFSGLMKESADGTLSPDLASSYTVSDDQLTYTFTLSNEAAFHDGSPVTPEDVVFTVHSAQNPGVKSPRRPNWEGVEVQAVDARTVSFTLKAPYGPFLENTTLGILPSHLWKSITAEEFPFSSLNANPVGSGPYQLEGVTQSGSGIPVEYDLSAFRSGARSPFIDRIIFKFYANPEALRDALNEGAVEAAHTVNPADFTEPHAVTEAVFARVFGVFFNQNQNDIFASAKVRSALDSAVDKEAIVQIVLSGYGSAIEGPLPPKSAQAGVHTAIPREERILAARAILESDGWKLGEDGVYAKTVKKETKRLSFSLATGNAPELKRAAEMVADDWKALGAEVDAKFFEQNDLNNDVLRPRKYEALLFGLVVGRDLDLFAFWHSSQRNDPGLNIALYANIDTDKKLELARAELDPVKRQEEVAEAAELIADETAAVFLYTPHFVYATPEAVRGMKFPPIVNPSDRFAEVDTWYLASEHVWPALINTAEKFSASVRSYFE